MVAVSAFVTDDVSNKVVLERGAGVELCIMSERSSRGSSMLLTAGQSETLLKSSLYSVYQTSPIPDMCAPDSKARDRCARLPLRL